MMIKCNCGGNLIDDKDGYHSCDSCEGIFKLETKTEIITVEVEAESRTEAIIKTCDMFGDDMKILNNSTKRIDCNG